MHRYTGVRVLTQALLESYLGIFIGKGVCREAFPHNKNESNLYFSDDNDGLLSFSLGLAMGTDKRVFVFCEDKYFIKNMSEFAQVGVSKCKNIFIVLLVSGNYLSPNTPTIFSEVSSQHGVLYNMGLLVHDYTKLFKLQRNPIKSIREYWERTKGPIVILLNTTKGTKEFPEIKLSSKKDIRNTKDFILDSSIIVNDFTPPFSIDTIHLEE